MLSVPNIKVEKVTNSAVEYEVQAQRSDEITGPLITGYEVIHFGVKMLGEYDNRGRVTFSLAVPGAQYRITAWALGDGRRSAPAAVDVTTREAGQCILCLILKTFDIVHVHVYMHIIGLV